jgi:hypothetical protein
MGNVGVTEEELLTLLLTAFPIFDKASFFPSLKSQVTSIDTFRDTRQLGETSVVGTEGFYNDPNRSIHVNIGATDLFAEDRGLRQQFFLATFFHKMLHAFLDIYSCQCSFCAHV